MPELKLISPLLDGMETVSCLSESGGISVYLLRSSRNGQPYILKHISIPESQTQVDALIFTGAAANEEDAQRYYEQRAEDYRNELADLDMLRASTNFATYLDYQVVPKEEGIGFEIYLLSERWQTLVEYLNENAMTHLKALNLGLDLCTALCDLRAHGLIHRDVKPENIYLNGSGGFMLGDLGIARIDELKYCSMPERMVTEYTAPELTDILQPFNTTIDIYSIGMVLYRILNGNHGPFEDERTSPKAANKRRVSGEELPAPLYSDYELTEIILKACAFQPEDRFQTPDELMQELVRYMKRNSVTDSLIVPPIVTDSDIVLTQEELEEAVEPVRFADVEELDEEFVHSFSPDTQSHGSAEDTEPEAPPGQPAAPAFAAPRTSALPDEEEPPPVPLPPPKAPRKRRIWIPIVAGVAALAVILCCVYFLVLGGPPIHVTSLDAVDRGTDYLIIRVDSNASGQRLILRCTDAYGNIRDEAYTGGDVSFQGLDSGTQYSITILSDGNKRLNGTTTAVFSTIATTDIVSFTATSPATGQVQLNLVISGPAPEQWTVRYWPDGGEPQETVFTGTTATIAGLESGLTYTFELQSTEDVQLSGMTTLEFATVPEVEITDLAAAILSSDSIRVTWASGEAVPEEWTVTCTGTDGTILTENVTECQADFTGLTAGETYTVSVTAVGATPATTTVTPIAASVSAMAAAVQEDGSVLVTWMTDSAESSWQLLATPDGGSASVSQTLPVTGTEATLTGLIPGQTYQLELRTASGERLGGSASTTVEIPAAETFNDYGVGRFFLGMFVRPAGETWTVNQLVTMPDPVFSSTDGIVFALESLTGRESSEDSVTLLYVVEDASGAPLSAGTRTAAWDALWNGDLILGEVAETPQEAGSYTLQIYLNGQLAATKEFSVS